MKHTTSHTQSSRSCSLVVQHSFLVIRQLAGSHGSPSYRITVKLLYYALLVHKEKSKTQSITATKLAPPSPTTSHTHFSFITFFSLFPGVRPALQSNSPIDSCPPLSFILHRILQIILHKSKCCDYSILYTKKVGFRELIYLAQGCSMLLLVFLGLNSSSAIALSGYKAISLPTQLNWGSS